MRPWVLATLLLAVTPPDVDVVLHQARLDIQAGHTAQAFARLKSANLLTPAPQPATLAPLLGLAAAGDGEPALAHAAWTQVRSRPGLPLLATLSVEARAMQVCPLPCRMPVREHRDLLAAPLLLQARYLRGLARVDGARALLLANAVVASAVLTQAALPRAERATLLAAAYDAAFAGKDKALAARLEILAWEAFPMEPAVAPVVRALDEPALLKSQPQESVVRHLEGLSDANQNGEVVRVAASLCHGDPAPGGKLCPAVAEPLRCPVVFAAGKSLRQARKAEEGAAMLGRVAQQCPALEERARFLELKALLAIKGAGPKAEEAALALVKRFPQSPLADDALVLAGEARQRLAAPGAAAFWEQARTQYPQGDMAFEAGRLLFLDALAHGDTPAARALLTNLGTTAAQRRWASYWLARTHPDAGARIAALEALVVQEPLSFEAALARGHLLLQGTGLPPPPVLPHPVESPIALSGELPSAGDALLHMAMDEDAAVLLAAALPGAAPGVDVGITRALAAAGALPTVSRHARTHWTNQLHGAPTLESAAIWELAYPLAHAQALQDAALATGLPPALLFALAREESAFDPQVNSLSGAVGLLQLLPATAVTEAMTLKIRLDNEQALKEPGVNARLGAAYLARLTRQFHGNHALALAAYNAGPGSVRRWLAADTQGSLDLFVETIPVPETRQYVARVMESAAAYAVLHNLGGPLVLAAPLQPPP